jgi:hypothetical protein
MIGNRAMSTHTSTRLRKLNPKAKPMTGTMARMGTVWRITAYG